LKAEIVRSQLRFLGRVSEPHRNARSRRHRRIRLSQPRAVRTRCAGASLLETRRQP
jgi:hypothetical protein